MSAHVDHAIEHWELHEFSTCRLRYLDVRVYDRGVLPGAVYDHRDVHVNGLVQFSGFLDDTVSPFFQCFTPARVVLHLLYFDLLLPLLIADLRQRR